MDICWIGHWTLQEVQGRKAADIRPVAADIRLMSTDICPMAADIRLMSTDIHPMARDLAGCPRTSA